MESRFRRLVGQRREKTGLHTHELEIHPVTFQSASAQLPQTVSLHQSLEPTGSEAHKISSEALLFKGLAYDAVVPGKAPVFVNKPQKGNGPIKLQTSRRLSSGELLATSQDSRRTLADIREGDYIVGRKQARELYTKLITTSGPSSGGSASPARYTITGRTESPCMDSIPIQPSETSPKSSLVIRHVSVKNSTPIQDTIPGAGPDIFVPSSPKIKSDSYEIRNDGPTGPDRFTPTEPFMGQNATIAALWKAEYGRLIQMYGQDGVDRNMSHPDLQSKMRRPSQSSTRGNSKPPSIVLEPLPQPTYERKSFESKRSSAYSRSSSYRDDASDASSLTRASMASSFVVSSSHTTQTSFGEFDSSATREDIRKIVKEMRSTYLRALEAQPPTPTKPKSSKKKRRPKASKMSSITTPAELLNSNGGRTTWHGDDTKADLLSEDPKKPRATSHSAQCFAGLSPTENTATASAPVVRPELQRADSMTLGSLVNYITTQSTIEPPETSASTSKQDKVPELPQTQNVCTNIVIKASNADRSIRVDVLELRGDAATPIMMRERKHVPPTKPPSSFNSVAVDKAASSSSSSSSQYAPMRPPPLPISQISLVNCI